MPEWKFRESMIFPIDVGELSILFAVTAIILLILSEWLSPYHRRINIFISRKRLRRVATLFSIFFLITVAVKVYGIIVGN
jgi:hypothetical protein